MRANRKLTLPYKPSWIDLERKTGGYREREKVRKLPKLPMDNSTNWRCC